jgi:hypothetical protein
MAPAPLRYALGVALLGSLGVAVLSGIDRLSLVVFALSVPHLYATFVVAAVKATTGGRAKHMADAITTLAEDRSYDRVAVLCGDAHREDVGEALERREWSVTTRGSTHPLGRLFGR